MQSQNGPRWGCKGVEGESSKYSTVVGERLANCRMESRAEADWPPGVGWCKRELSQVMKH